MQFKNRRERQKAATDRKKATSQNQPASQQRIITHPAPWYKKRYIWLVAGGIGVIILAFVIIFLLMSIQASRQTQAVATSVERVEQKIDELSEVYNGLSLEEREERLENLYDAIKEHDCRGEDALYHPLKKAADKCQTYNTHAKKLREETARMVSLLAYDKTVQSVLTDVMPTEDATSDDMQMKWHGAAQQLDELTPPDQVVTTHETVVTQADHIASAWETLIQADKDEDADRYTSTQETLVQAYDSLAATADALTVVYEEQQQRTWQAYEAFKKQI